MGAWNIREIKFGKSLTGCPETGVFVNSLEKADLGEEILRIISSARKSITIINPLISDERLIQMILATREHGVRVKIITEVRENRKSRISYPTRGFEVYDEFSLNEHFTAIRRLVMRRVQIRGMSYYAHAKVVLVDDEQLILSSANGTSNSLGWGSQPSVEAGISVNDPSLVSKLSTVIANVWEQCPFQFHLFDQDVSLQSRKVDQQVKSFLECEINENSQIVWSYPPDVRTLRDSLLKLIRHAREKITCVALSFYDTDKVDSIHTELLGALSRGVKVTVIVRPEHFRPDQYPDPSTKRLLENGLRLLGMSALHAKGMVVDGSSCAIFSGNINPYSLQSDANSAQVEIGLFEFGQLSVLRSYGKWLTSLEESADYEYG